MSEDDGRLADLREATAVVERSYDGVDPGDVLGSLEERLEVSRGPLDSITVERLSLEGGDGRLVAASAPRDAGTCSIEYRPYGPHGAMVIVVGLLFALPSFFLTVFLSFFGMHLYAKTEETELPVSRRTEIRAVLTEDDGGTTVTYAADAFLTVDADRTADLDFAHRKAVLAEVTDRHSLAIEGEPHYQNFDDVFFGKHIDAWWNRNAGADVEKIESLESEITERFEWHRAYTDSLLEDAPETVATNLERAREELEGRLGEFLEDVDRQVEREDASV